MKKLVVALSLAASVLASAPVFAADSLVVYSGRSDKFIKPVVKEFEDKTGIKVILHSAKSTALLNKLDVEGSRTEADLYISNDAGNLEFGSQKGLFAKLPSSVTNPIPANYRASDNSWVGLSARARVLVVNTGSKNADNFNSIFDLAKPENKGRIAITHSANESFIAGVTVYMEEKGRNATKDWLQGLKDNSGGKVFSKHSHIVKNVARGKADVGLVNHYYIYRHLAEHPSAPLKIVLPDQSGMGVAWNVAGVAISKYSKKRQLAEKFVEFLVSEKGQKIFAEVNNEYPTRNGVAAANIIPAAGSFKVADVPMTELGRKRSETINLLEEVGMP